ncbi:hypothetical protein HWV62_4621 [Athelia sp. TMB]|nr:hypothetical protein HWV62_4621 [Athelia sp. TMB]
MPPRPQRTPKPTEKVVASMKSISPRKRKARQSSSEVEIVEGSPAPSTPSPSKTRGRPSARNKLPVTPSNSTPLKALKISDVHSSDGMWFSSSHAKPVEAQAPSRCVNLDRCASSSNRFIHGVHRSTAKASQVGKFPAADEQSAPVVISFEDERRAVDSEGDEITDPDFFNGPEKYVHGLLRSRDVNLKMRRSALPVVQAAAEYSSDDYWHTVESVHESDNDFIDDSAEVPVDADTSNDEDSRTPPRVRPSKKSKGKAPMRVLTDDEEDVSHKKRKSMPGMKQAVVTAQLDPASDSDNAGLSAHELQQIAEAKRQSLANAALPNRKGSTSTSAQSAKPAEPVAISGVPSQTQSARSSKLLKAMDKSAAKIESQPPVVVDHTTVYLEDLEVGVRGESGPAECEVKNTEDEDRGLLYVGLCYLWLVRFVNAARNVIDPFVGGRLRYFRSWSDLPHIGLGTYSAWPEQCPDLNKKQLKRLFEFQDHLHIRNASRTVPSNLAGKSLRGGNTILIAAGSRDTTIQFATILFTTAVSSIHSLQRILGEDRRAIQGVPQIVKWERMQSVLCMAHNIPYANVNMKAGSITFCTGKTMRGPYASGGSSPAKNPDRFLKKVPAARQTNDATSPFKGPKDTVTGSGFIPVLDAIGAQFNMEDDLLDLDRKLPAYEGEIPEGSCVWVGYTSTKYTASSGAIGLNFNLMWVVVVGTP